MDRARKRPPATWTWLTAPMEKIPVIRAVAAKYPCSSPPIRGSKVIELA
jgi:hypothetical protein